MTVLVDYIVGSSEDVTKLEELKGIKSFYKLTPTVKKDGSEGRPSKEYGYLNIVTTGEFVEELLKVIDFSKSVIKTLTITGGFEDYDSIPVELLGRVFHKPDSLPKGFSPLGSCTLYLDSAWFSDLRGMVDYSSQAKGNVRFYGGDLLAVEGLGVGYFGEGSARDFGIVGKEVPKVLFTGGSYDFFEVLGYSRFLEDTSWQKDFVGVVSKKTKPRVKVSKPKFTKEKPAKKVKEVKVKEPKVKAPTKKDLFKGLINGKVSF